MKHTLLRLITILSAACMLLPAARLVAQVQNATVTGSITDVTGAAIPGAAVTITDLETGVASAATSGSVGLYRIESLLPGNYRINVQKEGFKSAVREGIVLHAQDAAALNIALEVGSVSETVTVETGGTQMELENATVSQVIQGDQIEDAPLNGRNVMNLIGLTAGVVPQGSTSGSALGNQSAAGNFTNPSGWGNYQIGGGVAGDNAQFLDGAPLNLQSQNELALVPVQDTIGEFRVESSNVGSEYGRYYGGVVNFTTKAGTKDFHGTAYEYLRNTVLDANAFFNNSTGVARPYLLQNQYGADVGGPLTRKAFFFAGWEGFSNRSGIPYETQVPTVAETTGNFTADAPIYNVFTGAQISCNGVLNTVCPDPTALAIASTVKYWPAPNTTPNAQGINFKTNASAGSNSNQYVGRVDFNPTKQQQLFARYTYWSSDTQPTNYFHNSIGVQPAAKILTNQAVIGHTYTINSTTVSTIRASYTRFGFSAIPPSLGKVDLSEFGPAYGALQDQVSFDALPIVFLIGYGPTVFPLLYLDDIQFFHFNTYDLSGNISKTWGRHTFDAGGTARRIEGYYSAGTIFPVGFFLFVPYDPTTSVFANFLLGDNLINPESALTVGNKTSVVEPYQGYYGKDVYQASRNLTLTFGLRWELPGAFSEKHNKESVFLPNVASPLGTIANPATGSSQALQGNIELVDSQAYPSRYDDKLHYDLFAPTFGVAYQLNPNTAIRAGYGIAFPALDGSYAPSPVQSPINSASTQISGNLSNPFAQSGGIVAQPPGRSPGYSAAIQGLPVDGRVPGSTYQYAQQWNLNVQRQFGRDSVLQVGYLGSKGLHLTMQNNINQVPDSQAAKAAQQYSALVAGGTPAGMADAETFLNVPVANPLAGKLATGSLYNTPAIASGQLLRPFPQFGNVTNMAANVGSSDYESLQATFQKRFGGAGVLMAAYSWSKLIGTIDSATGYLESTAIGAVQDYNNINGERSLESFDVPHRLVINYSVVLPFGRNHKFLSETNSIVDRVISGWRFSGISTFQSGFPVAIAAVANDLSNYYGAGTIRPNVVPACKKTLGGSALNRVQQPGATWFNTSCFEQPPTPFSFGNESRVDSAIRSEGIDNWDLSLAKDVAIKDRFHVSFEGEFLNAFNRVQFAPPNSQLGGASFGTVTAQANNPRQLQFALRTSF